ncbi:hypothetical protein JM18_001895 [Phytophthora kernoviae]|uniref:Cleft lip and palate transmembrane protein 1 n=2 Tax=Phytophthora kernoviae TaxID=325452 RepID=A0A8T0M5J3_9STRA|nr:hypothetical protein G195_008146 [Phytophthora kernoviae 00238/432]KAG2529670.1 hypothetical protein JM16_001891 [Phytophthora kernoviae]KAG2531023.1 hypothetical protein JM18_001895 [Phytophthora kernoviae]
MTDAAPPPDAGGDAAPAQESFMDRLWPMLRMLCFYYAITSGMNLFMPQKQQQRPRDSVSDPQVAATTSNAKTRPLQLLENNFHLGDLFNLRVYVNSQEQFTFAPDEDTAAVEKEQEQLRWYQDALTYDATPNPEREDGVWIQEMNVSVDEHLLSNGSVYAHVFLTKEGYSPNPTDSSYDNINSIYRTLELTVFRPPPKIVKKRNLLESQVEEEEEQKEVEAVEDGQVDGEGAYISMWKPAFYVNVVLDHSQYSVRQPPPPFVSTEMDVDQEAGLYKPVLFMNEFWMLEEQLIPVNDTLTALPLQISFYTLPMYKYALYTQMEQNFKNQEATGTSSKRDTDNMKSMFIETNPYLLAVTMVVSLLHSLFDFLAFKNDVSFWKNQKSLVGLSLRTIVLNTFFQLVIFLYLMDNDTSWLILVQSGIALLIDIWKIKKAVVFSRDADNKLVVSGVESYEDSPTAEHDRVAVAHLSYVLYPLIIGQAAYTLTYGVHKGWYSWVVSSLTSFVYAFGFIMMTPQLYINYKLKSVAHLPWRAMVYKSLNTFIDDLFAFVIKMPWMHRLSCFRDDLIFFIYLYQRWKYPVDVKRTNEFGQGPIEEDEGAAANAIEGAPKAGNVESEVVASEDVAAAVNETEDIPPPPSTPPSTEYMMSKRGKEPALDDDADIDISRLSAVDRDAIMARVTPDDSTPPDAFALAQNEIRREMIDRGIQPKGFYNDDAARLQEEFNREHAAEKDSRVQQKVQFAAKSYLRETVHRRRLEREKEVREEVEEIAKNPQLEVWLGLAKADETPKHADLRVNSIGARALCKTLAFTHSLRSLNLSRNALDDATGKWLALLLKRNTSLRRLELESNCLGPLAVKDLSEALSSNESLEYLNLESNPLTDDEKDFSGVAALGNMLTKNKTLRTLNLWRTRLGSEGGKQLALYIARNSSLVCLDVGNNRIATADAVSLDVQLKKNRVLFEEQQLQQLKYREAQWRAADKERERQDNLAKRQEDEEWMEKRKLEREQDRTFLEEERKRLLKVEEDRLRQVAVRKAAEFAAKAEMEKKKKKKKAGGKKKKK